MEKSIIVLKRYLASEVGSMFSVWAQIKTNRRGMIRNVFIFQKLCLFCSKVKFKKSQSSVVCKYRYFLIIQPVMLAVHLRKYNQAKTAVSRVIDKLRMTNSPGCYENLNNIFFKSTSISFPSITAHNLSKVLTTS